MRILTRYTLSRIVTTMVSTFLIFAFLVMAVETFMHLDSFISGDGLGPAEVAGYAFSALSNYYLLLLSVACLFSVSYFLSDMSANNELIAIYGAGISRTRLVAPIMMMSVVLTVLVFLFNESFGTAWKDVNIRLGAEYFGQSGTSDPTNISLYDEGSGYLVHARSYGKTDMRLYSPTVVAVNGNAVVTRLDARYADYGPDGWTFHDAKVVTPGDAGISVDFHTVYADEGFTIEPELFESRNMRMETMDASSALDYLGRLKNVNPASYQEKMTEFFSRFFEPLSVFVMSAIAIMMNYTFKKNILLFSIVQSLVIAVVYYVSDMVFSIISRQGIVPAYTVVVCPLLLTVLLSLVISKVGKRI